MSDFAALNKRLNLPDEMHGRFHASIILAADSIDKLRHPDVYRVVEDFNRVWGGGARIMASYIATLRPDLAAEATLCAEDIEP